MTIEQFRQWEASLHEELFHVEKTDICHLTGVRIDQLRVIMAISASPQVLQYRSLKHILEHFDVLT